MTKEDPAQGQSTTRWNIEETNGEQPLSLLIADVAPSSVDVEVLPGIRIVGLPLGRGMPNGEDIILHGLWKKLHPDYTSEAVSLAHAPVHSFGMEALVSLPAVSRFGGLHFASLALKALFALGGLRNASVPVLMSHSLGSIEGAAEKSIRVVPIDLYKGRTRMHFHDRPNDEAVAQIESLAKRFEDVWIGEEKERFRLAWDSIDASRYAVNPRVALAALWSAAETLFSKDATENTFKMTGAWAALSHPPGELRLAHQRMLQKLYSTRSKAVHGHPERRHEFEKAYSESIGYLIDGPMRQFVEDGHLPTATELQERIFS